MCKLVGRIQDVATAKGITIGALERVIGASKGVLSRAINNNTDIQSKWIELLVENYPDISPIWLVTGKGNMFATNDAIQPQSVVSLTHDSNKRIDSQYIPVYPIEATASILSTFSDSAIIPEGHLLIPNLTKVDGAVYVTGDSMYPILKSGDIVVFQQIQNIEYMIYGNVYLVSFNIDGDEYIVLKYIQKSEKEDHIKLVSHNQHHSDLDIPRSSIRALALVKASIRYNSL